MTVLNQGTDAPRAFARLRDLLSGQGNPATFVFSPFHDRVSAASVFRGESVPSADVPEAGPVSWWTGWAPDGTRLSFGLHLETGEITLDFPDAGGGSSFRSTAQFVQSGTSPSQSWLFLIPGPDDQHPPYALSVTQPPVPDKPAAPNGNRWLIPNWVASVEIMADRLEGDLRRVSQLRPWMRYDADYQTAERALKQARDYANQCTLAVDGRMPRLHRARLQVADWWTGHCVDKAWSELHTAGQALISIVDEGEVKAHLADMVATVVTELTAGDLRIDTYLKTLHLLAAPDRRITPADRAQLRAIRQVCDSAGDGGHADARSYRNTLILVGSFLALVLAIVAAVAWWDPEFRTFFASPLNRHPSAWYVLEIELIASLSGLTGAVLSLRNYTGFAWTYGLPFVQALLKGSTGAATGLFGVVLVLSGVVTSLKLSSQWEVFAVAIIFGYAQYLFTRVIDQKAVDVLKNASSRNDPSVAAQVPAGTLSPSFVTTPVQSPANE